MPVPMIRQYPAEHPPQSRVEDIHRPVKCVEKLPSAALLGRLEAGLSVLIDELADRGRSPALSSAIADTEARKAVGRLMTDGIWRPAAWPLRTRLPEASIAVRSSHPSLDTMAGR